MDPPAMKRRALGTAAAGLSLLVIGAAAMPLTASAQPSGPATSSVKRYIVQADSHAAVEGLTGVVRKSGGNVKNVYSTSLAGFSATMTADQAQQLASQRGVTAVNEDKVFHSTTIQTNPTWGLDRIDQRTTAGNKRYDYSTTGAGVTAFVVDTGIRLTHSQFGTRAKSGYDFVDHDTNASDCEGHGTHVSGTIGGSTYGAAKGVKLVAVRVLDCEGSGWASDIIDGLDWVIAHRSGPSVVNMSLGGGVYAPLDAAVERTVAAGVNVVVAAGNDGADACDSSPARAPHAITVAATDSSDVSPWWSNAGSCVDMFAPGVDVLSASNASNTATETMSGTSMATPHVVGLVARYLQTSPKATPAQVTAALVAASTKNVVIDPWGAPNRLLYAAPAAVAHAPGAPASVVASKNDKTNTGTISWAVPASNGGKAITGYRVTRNGTDAKGVGPKVVIVSATSRSYTFTSLRDRTSYALSVSAINSVGTGTAVTKTITLV
jgi:subtilisin family serine protease